MRSLLFVPADSERKLDYARHSGADALILDLKDSGGAGKPPGGAKSSARFFGFERICRFPPLRSHQPLGKRGGAR